MRIITGIACTTHLDLQNERMTKSALMSMASQINKKFIPQLVDHNWAKHIGAILYGEVFQLKDGEYALGIVLGIFTNSKEKLTYKTGTANKVWKDFKKYFDISNLLRLNEHKHLNKRDNPSPKKMSTADLLEKYLDSTQVSPDGSIYTVKRFIASTGDLRIEVYPKDHFPPHFHVISKNRGINARFHIKTLEVINSKSCNIKQSDIFKIQNFLRVTPNIVEKLQNEYSRLQEASSRSL